MHELIHMEIYKHIPNKYKYRHRETNQYLLKEEKIIYNMLGETWLKSYDKFYQENFPTNKKNKGDKKKWQNTYQMVSPMLVKKNTNVKRAENVVQKKK